MGIKDACSYFRANDHKMVYGVCCQKQPHPFPVVLPVYPAHQFIVPGIQQPILPEVDNPTSPEVSSPIATTSTTTKSTTTSTSPATTTTTVEDSTIKKEEEQSVCGQSIHYPIRYTQDGDVQEEIDRINGEHDLKIVNGWPAGKHEWPWMAALFNSGRQFCGGSLITKRHVLTAAHCVAQMTRTDVNRLEVRLGEHDIKDAFDTQVETRKVSKIVRHKGFSSQTLWNDVAIIFLSEPVEYSDTIRPVCLSSSSDPYEKNETATVVGWGSLREAGPQPNILQEVTLRIWPNSKCVETYGTAAPGGIRDHMLCAGRQGKDSCSGDSGGPMVKAKGDRWEQIGIVSWGIGCGKSHFPGVYTRVAKMHDWIQNVLEKFV